MNKLDTGLHYPIDIGNLPGHWTSGYIEDFVDEIESGFACGKHNSEGNGIDHLRPMNIARSGKIELDDIRSVPADYNEKRLFEDDVLFNNTNSPELIGKTAYVGKDGAGKAFSNHMTRIKFRDGVNPRFSALQLHYLWMMKYYLHRCVKHVNQASISTRDMARSIPFVLPPPSEQDRIVAKIEELFSELDKGIESLKTAREQLKVYRQAVLKHAFEGKLTAQWRAENADKLESPEQLRARIQQERQARYQQQFAEWKSALKAWEENGNQGRKPVKPKLPKGESLSVDRPASLPETWTWRSVSELNTEIFDGPFGSNLKSSDYVESGVRVIRLENIGRLEFIEDKYSYVTEEKYALLEKHTVRAGDLIFSSFITDGVRVVVLPNSVDRAINKADCFCVRIHGQSIRSDYLAAYLSTRSAYKQVEAEIHGVGRPRINTTQLKAFCIPICSPVEQNELMAKIENALSAADQTDSDIGRELKRIEILRQSILKKAFRGQLILPDSGKELVSSFQEFGAEKGSQSFLGELAGKDEL